MGYFTRTALIAAMPGSERLPSIADTGVDTFLAEFRREAPPLLRIGLVASALLYHLGPVLTVYVPAPAFLLPKALRDRHINKLCAHPWYPLRSLALTLKMLAGLCWGKHPAVRAAFNMPPLEADPGTWRGES